MVAENTEPQEAHFSLLILLLLLLFFFRGSPVRNFCVLCWIYLDKQAPSLPAGVPSGDPLAHYLDYGHLGPDLLSTTSVVID